MLIRTQEREVETTMKVPFMLLLASSARAFVPNTRSVVRSVAPLFSSASSSTDTDKFTKGPRIVKEELPVVYVYDHCPFCVRVRLALGIKNVKHLVYFMANDDIPTPTKLVGKKIAPIFVSDGRVSLFWSLLYSLIKPFWRRECTRYPSCCGYEYYKMRAVGCDTDTCFAPPSSLSTRNFPRTNLSWPNQWTLFSKWMEMNDSAKLVC